MLLFNCIVPIVHKCTIAKKERETNMQTKKVAINDALPLKAARRDANAKLKSLLGLQIWAADEPNTVTFIRFAVERQACAMDYSWNTIVRVGKNSGPILSRL